jgi:hypothetical protein
MDSLRENGLTTTLVRPFILAADYWFDFRYGTDTNKYSFLKDLDISSANKDHGNAYMPTRLAPLRKLFRVLQPAFPANPVLVDFGSGKGRVLMIAGEFGFRAARGVEFAPELCARCRENCAAYKNTTRTVTEFEVIQSDVVDYSIRPDENVFFFYNPFDGVVLNQVLANIANSLQKAPRSGLVVYCNPYFDGLIEQRKIFRKISTYRFWGYRFSVFSFRS